MMVQPVRLLLSRAGGFNLQAHSRKINGLPAVKVDRATNYGNPWVIGTTIDLKMAKRWGWSISPEGRRHVCKCARESVEKFAHALLWDAAIHDHLRAKLGGRNLACWCHMEAPCHTIPLLIVANSKPGDIDALHAAIDKVILEAAAQVFNKVTS